MIAAKLATMRESRAVDFFATPERYVTGNYRIPIRAALLREILPDTTKKSMIDLGCGDGAISAALKAKSLTLIDSSEQMLVTARERCPGSRHICGDIHDVTGEYEVALCIGMMAHVESTDRLMRTLADLIAPNGTAVIQISDYSQPIGKLNSLILRLCGRLNYRRTRLEDVVRSAERHGLRLASCRRHLLIPAGMEKLLGRFLVPVELLIARTWFARHAADAMLVFKRAI